jgi:hypothetical protein
MRGVQGGVACGPIALHVQHGYLLSIRKRNPLLF